MAALDRRSWSEEAEEVFGRYLDMSRLRGRRGLVPCIFHGDQEASLSVDLDKATFYCFGCSLSGGVTDFKRLVGIARVVGLKPSRPKSSTQPARPPEWVKPPRVADLAAARRFPLDLLYELGWTDVEAGIRMPFYYRDGRPARAQLRLGGRPRFLWEQGTEKIVPYGRWRLPAHPEYLLIVEGVTDTAAGILHGIPTLGVPGASMAGRLEHEDVAGVPRLYAINEGSTGGATFIDGIRARLLELRWKGELGIVVLPVKDLCALHQTNCRFEHFLMAAIEAAARVAL